MKSKLLMVLFSLTLASPAHALPSYQPAPLPPIKFTPNFTIPSPAPSPTPRPYTVEDCRAQIIVTIDSVPDDFPGENPEVFKNTCERLAALCRRIPPGFAEPLPDNPDVTCSRNDCNNFVAELCGYLPEPPPLNPAGLCEYNAVSSGPVCVETSS